MNQPIRILRHFGILAILAAGCAQKSPPSGAYVQADQNASSRPVRTATAPPASGPSEQMNLIP